MNNTLRQFRRMWLWLTLIILATGNILFFTTQGIVGWPVLVLILFVAAITYLSFTIIAKTVEKRFSTFTNYMMAGSMIKMLILAIVMVVYALIDRQGILSFGIALLILYFVYLFLEVVWLLRMSKNRT